MNLLDAIISGFFIGLIVGLIFVVLDIAWHLISRLFK